MSIKLSDSIRVGQQKPLEDKYFNELVPYTSTSQVNTLIPKAVRHIGLTVNINGEEYWYKNSIEDDDLIFKSNQKTIEITREELYNDLIPNEKLEPNRLYKITGVESWCFSQHLIKAIYLKAITNNTLESEGVGEFYTPKYNTSDSNLGIWKGELLANGMISSATYNIGDKVIWGNLFWENISGNIGTNEKEYYDIENDEYLYPKLQNYLSETDWQLITPNDNESLYNIQFDAIKYDLENDYINYRADNLGNIYEISYITLLNFFPNTGIRNFIPEFIYNMNSIALFQWGRGNTSNNFINESVVLNCNNNHVFQNNIITENSKIFDNNFLNVSIIGNTLKNASIVSNYLKSYGGLFYNNLEDSIISSNRYYFEISYNNLKYNSSISNNNDNNIIVNIKYSSIRGNILNNSCSISNNIFVEEGKEVDFNIKSIHGNELINNSEINNNIIKNGSKIMDHNLSYFSTINGNTLDTESNIYNNQVIQNGKIDNNILTGHGRIYGNQLDRRSEITNCKLRIYPTTSYSSGMHGNRLFTGKIQNVDFGDIVNPVGTNPNDPAFGGNGLTGCIIENGSIIKDLTFPNHGGVGIQFIKMNGYSEFKNITVNDSIRNVDFINTIFNETSDYSKLIEGSGFQTNGFTKTYIDNVLLQDKFNKKQDVLTEDNVGEFMDLELATKSTPTSGDTVLGRDSLTGKAVEIPTSSFGGNVDLTTKLDKGGYAGTAQDLKNDIDGIQIGGSNLIIQSRLRQGYLNAGTGIAVGSAPDHHDPNYYDCNSGEIFTHTTYDVYTSGYGGDGYMCFYDLNKTFIASYVLSVNGVKGSKTIVTPQNAIYYRVASIGKGIKEKLERGNKATDWTPAPEDKQDRLQDISGNVGVGKPDASTTEKLDVNGNVQANGFKTPDNSANKALTSDGGVFDLNTKADLVGGKVSANQLPSYVDDVLEFSTFASFPATGESGKIYIAIDTNLTYRWGGSSYVVMSSSLALGETASTAYRGDRGKTAYEHSQKTTGNPHNTKVEELSDVGNETTTIVDTDVILKKDTGGFWKKITFANFKNWFTTELSKKINIGLDTIFNFKNISAMPLSQFKSITPNTETIYFTEEQDSTGWQQVRYNSNFFQGCTELVEKAITINAEAVLELDSDSNFNLIDVANTKINGVFENDFVIITFSGQVWTQNTATANQWVKLILKINGVQAAVAPVFYLTEPAGTPERISYSFALNVTAEMVTHGATLHLKPSAYVTLYRPSITVARVHKSINANL